MGKFRAVIIDPDGTFRETEIENDLGAFQAVVGGYIEGVFSNMATIYVNEEGLIIGLPFNPLATKVANDFLEVGVRLVGTALILGPGDGYGNDTHVRQSVIDYIMEV